MSYDDQTFAEHIEGKAGEPIEAIVIGGSGWNDDYGLEEMAPLIPEEQRNLVLSWEEARPWLDRAYSSGYGSPSCYAITAWTATKVLFVSQYDGATGVESVPRHPVDHEPEMPGG